MKIKYFLELHKQDRLLYEENKNYGDNHLLINGRRYDFPIEDSVIENIIKNESYDVRFCTTLNVNKLFCSLRNNPYIPDFVLYMDFRVYSFYTFMIATDSIYEKKRSDIKYVLGFVINKGIPDQKVILQDVEFYINNLSGSQKAVIHIPYINGFSTKFKNLFKVKYGVNVPSFVIFNDYFRYSRSLFFDELYEMQKRSFIPRDFFEEEFKEDSRIGIDN